MPAPTSSTAANHLTDATRSRMFHAPWQRYAWAALPLASISTLAFVPFVVAWRRRVVPAWVAGLYVLGSASWWTMATIKPDGPDALLTRALRVFIAAATIHVLLLDPIKRQAK
ncbi:hypothetical protein ACFV5G_19510 [Streptomyces sp. NPDC059766]|uniref:hypothetical protein n=1 Tax=Streptomyces sp. NPDC059766 TaxID=3346940 RepID=UPI0036654868